MAAMRPHIAVEFNLVILESGHCSRQQRTYCGQAFSDTMMSNGSVSGRDNSLPRL